MAFFPFSQSTDEKVYKFRYFKIASSVLFVNPVSLQWKKFYIECFMQLKKKYVTASPKFKQRVGRGQTINFIKVVQLAQVL